ncbi:MAG TPA: hypothetical protein VHE83_11760 [Mycobacteriales bacterium]|nr:hypothetical protein [Mycobacteriales bacterium]
MRRVSVLAAVAAVAAATAAFSGDASADSVFSLSASTSGVSVVAYNETFPFVQSLQMNAPSATATLNSRGQATAYAATPDPGHDASELPAVLAGTICSLAPIPDCPSVSSQVPRYPVAYAQSGDQPQDVALPAAHLHAEATSTSATSEAVVGVSGATSATSTTRLLANPDGTEDATADTDVDALTLATYFKIAGVHATATLHRAADGGTTTDSSFEIASFDVAGQTFGFKDGQFDVLGNLVPLPVPVQTVFDALAAIGVKATYLPADKTKDGITSAGLELSYQAPAPPTGALPPLPALPIPIGIGLPSAPTTVTYTLGRVSTTGTYHAIPSGGDGVIGGGLTGPSSTPTSPATTNPGTSTPPPTSTGVGSDGNPGSSGFGSVPPSGTDGVVPPSVDNPVVAVPQPGGGGVVTTAAGKPLTTDSLDIYLALVVAAFAAFGGATAIRFLGVRRTWTS